MDHEISIEAAIVEKTDPLFELFTGAKDTSTYSADDFIATTAGLKKGDVLNVKVNTNGGNIDAGIRIYNEGIELRRRGVVVNTKNMGKQHSIGHIIMLMGEKREGFNSSVGVIHLPRISPEYFFQFWGGVTVENLDEIKADLQLDEDRILDIYADVTGQNKEALRAIMYQEKNLSAAQLLKLNFLTSLVDGKPSAASPAAKPSENAIYSNAYKFNIKTDKMAMKPSPVAKGIMNAIEAKLKKLNLWSASNIDIKTEEGTPLHVDREDDAIAVGDTATIGEGSTDGEVTLTDGRKVTVAAGVITEIQAPEGENELETLKADNVALVEAVNFFKAQFENLKKEMGEITTNYRAPAKDDKTGGKKNAATPKTGKVDFQKLNEKYNPKPKTE